LHLSSAALFVAGDFPAAGNVSEQPKFFKNLSRQFARELTMVPPIATIRVGKDISWSKEEAWTSAG